MASEASVRTQPHKRAPTAHEARPQLCAGNTGRHALNQRGCAPCLWRPCLRLAPQAAAQTQGCPLLQPTKAPFGRPVRRRLMSAPQAVRSAGGHTPRLWHPCRRRDPAADAHRPFWRVAPPGSAACCHTARRAGNSALCRTAERAAAGAVQRGTHSVPRLFVGAALEQKPHNLRVAVVCGVVQRRVATLRTNAHGATPRLSAAPAAGFARLPADCSPRRACAAAAGTTRLHHVPEGGSPTAPRLCNPAWRRRPAPRALQPRRRPPPRQEASFPGRSRRGPSAAQVSKSPPVLPAQRSSVRVAGHCRTRRAASSNRRAQPCRTAELAAPLGSSRGRAPWPP